MAKRGWVAKLAAEALKRLPPISANLFGMFFVKTHRKTVILRACDFLDLSCLLHIQPAVSQAPQQNRHPERSASQIYRKQRALRRAVEEPVLSGVEGTPAMLVGRCSRGLSGRELQRKIKSHNL
jgi:hypothetical protein